MSWSRAERHQYGYATEGLGDEPLTQAASLSHRRELSPPPALTGLLSSAPYGACYGVTAAHVSPQLNSVSCRSGQRLCFDDDDDVQDDSGGATVDSPTTDAATFARMLTQRSSTLSFDDFAVHDDTHAVLHRPRRKQRCGGSVGVDDDDDDFSSVARASQAASQQSLCYSLGGRKLQVTNFGHRTVTASSLSLPTSVPSATCSPVMTGSSEPLMRTPPLTSQALPTLRMMSECQANTASTRPSCFGAAAALDAPSELVIESGYYTTRGPRTHQEDRAHFDYLAGGGNEPRTYFAAVYDGHKGDQAAQYACDHLHEYVRHDEHYTSDIARALVNGIRATDVALLESNLAGSSGTTVLAACIRDRHLTIANLGDCRAVLGLRDGTCIDLTHDHRMSQPSEKMRVSGLPDAKALEGLSVTRGLADYELKPAGSVETGQCALTNIAEITTHYLCDDCEFLLLASDGVWDRLSSQDAATSLHEQFAAHCALFGGVGYVSPMLLKRSPADACRPLADPPPPCTMRFEDDDGPDLRTPRDGVEADPSEWDGPQQAGAQTPRSGVSEAVMNMIKSVTDKASDNMTAVCLLFGASRPPPS